MKLLKNNTICLPLIYLAISTFVIFNMGCSSEIGSNKTGELSREKAKQLINANNKKLWEEILTNIYDGTISFETNIDDAVYSRLYPKKGTNSSAGNFNVDDCIEKIYAYYGDSTFELTGLENIVKENFINIHIKDLIYRLKKNYKWSYCMISPGDKINNYITNSSDWGFRSSVNSGFEVVEITGMTKPNTNGNPTFSIAELTYVLKRNPFGKALYGKEVTEKRKGKAVFVLYDDGWRLRELLDKTLD